MASFRRLLASFLFSSTAAVAQMPPPGAPPVDIAVLLDLDATRADQVHAIMKVAHERIAEARRQIGRPSDDSSRVVMRAAMDAIHAETESALATVLSADELAKLHEAMPTLPRPMRSRAS
jgi:hypothetical protein